MNAMNYDRKTLKERAKSSLRGTQPRPWKVTLVYLLLASLIPVIITSVMEWAGNSALMSTLWNISSDPEGWLNMVERMSPNEMMAYYTRLFSSAAGAGVLATLVSVLISLFQEVMGYGYAGYSLKLFRGEQTAVRDIFSALPMAGRVICTVVMVGIFTFLWSLLATLLALCATMILTAAMMAVDPSASIMILFVLLMIAVWVAACVAIMLIAYRYSLAPYFIMTTDMGTMEAIRESKNAMRGNLGRRFVLGLSFIGWGLLVALIVYAVMFVGMFILMLALGFGMAMSGAMIEQMNPAQIMTPVIIGAAVIAVVAWLASLALNLWLTAYRGAAEAGFFLAMTGQDDARATSHAAPEYIPPQPSDIWNNVPTPPSFTPSTPEAPAPAEEAPAPVAEAPVPEQPSAPETPEDVSGEQEPSEGEAPTETAAPAEAAPIAEETAPEAPAVAEDEPPKEETEA